MEHDEECATLCPVPDSEKCRIGHSCWCADPITLLDPADPLAFIGTEFEVLRDTIETELSDLPEGDDPAVAMIGLLDGFISTAGEMRGRLLAKMGREPADDVTAALLAALEGLFREHTLIHKHWGDGNNARAAAAAEQAAREAIAAARGEAVSA